MPSGFKYPTLYHEILHKGIRGTEMDIRYFLSENLPTGPEDRLIRPFITYFAKE